MRALKSAPGFGFSLFGKLELIASSNVLISAINLSYRIYRMKLLIRLIRAFPWLGTRINFLRVEWSGVESLDSKLGSLRLEKIGGVGDSKMGRKLVHVE